MNQTFGHIKTQQKPVVLVFDFTTTTTAPVYFIAKDQQHRKTVYFNREYIPPVPGPQQVELTLPFSAAETELVTFSPGPYAIQSITTYNMRKRGVVDAELSEFLQLAERFAREFKYSDHKDFRSASGKYVFHYVPAIRDDKGLAVPTPMQVDHLTGDIWIDSNRVSHYTSQMVVPALLHENFHYRLDTKDEEACDLSAAEVAADNGYMATEIYHAYTSVFDDSAENIRRSSLLDNFLQRHRVDLRG